MLGRKQYEEDYEGEEASIDEDYINWDELDEDSYYDDDSYYDEDE